MENELCTTLEERTMPLTQILSPGLLLKTFERPFDHPTPPDSKHPVHCGKDVSSVDMTAYSTFFTYTEA